MDYIQKYIGRVIEGERLGRELKFPTINIQPQQPLGIKTGVYLVRTIIQGHNYYGVANYGSKPTVGNFAPLIEVHILDFDTMIYNQMVEIYFLEFIREEQKFDSIAHLKEQIGIDIEYASSIIASRI